jgi:hypothetical protein
LKKYVFPLDFFPQKYNNGNIPITDFISFTIKMALGRHIKERTVCGSPNFVCFTPQGCEKTVETVQLFCDELEAMRLKHEQGLDIVQ